MYIGNGDGHQKTETVGDMINSLGQDRVNLDSAAQYKWRRNRRAAPPKEFISIGVIILAVTILIASVFRKRRRKNSRSQTNMPITNSSQSINNRSEQLIAQADII